MKFQLLYFSILLLVAACNPSQPTQNQTTELAEPVEEAPEPTTPPAAAATVEPVVLPSGDDKMFVGPFVAVDYDENRNISYSNKITLAIRSLENGIVKGYSVVAGNSRPFEGTYTEKDGTIDATASEPGDDKYDGVFTFRWQRGSSTLTGTWKANNTKLGVTKRKFTLEQRVFRYDANLELSDSGIAGIDLYNTLRESEGDADMAEILTEDAEKFNASKVLLRKADVENMHKGDLEVTRNAIYARHGYSFKNRRMRYLFDSYVDWYMPVSTDVSRQFTELERKNIELLKRYEQHAASYYDSFGR